MEEIINYVFQYGVGVACLVYLMYFQNTSMKDLISNQQQLNATLKEVSTNLSNINIRLNDIEEKVNRKEN